MYCRNCGTKLKEGAKFCNECGIKVETKATSSNTNITNSVGTTPINKNKAIASMVLGILSFILGVIFLPIPIIGLILGIKQKEKCEEKTTGIILNSVALGSSVLIWVFMTTFIAIGIANSDNDYETNDNDLNEVETSELYDDNIWNKYENNRIEEILDFNVDIKGNWKSYVDNDSYYTFDGTKFYYYEDLSDAERDYWEGTYSYKVGKEELKKIYINNKYINKIIDKIDLDENFYIIELKPTKIVDDNIEEPINKDKYELIRLLFIKEHEDGVEGIFVYPEDEEIEYYYKVK